MAHACITNIHKQINHLQKLFATAQTFSTKLCHSNNRQEDNSSAYVDQLSQAMYIKRRYKKTKLNLRKKLSKKRKNATIEMTYYR